MMQTIFSGILIKLQVQNQSLAHLFRANFMEVALARTQIRIETRWVVFAFIFFSEVSKVVPMGSSEKKANDRDPKNVLDYNLLCTIP